MKAIILAAGSGSRLNKYTKDSPKCMLSVLGKSIIARQIDLFHSFGIHEIAVVKGYLHEKIDVKTGKSYVNEIYDRTNMVYSFFCAREELNDDLIISYGDILFDERVLKNVIEDKHDIAVVVDKEWKDYWLVRYGRLDYDLESLKFGPNGEISEIGYPGPEINAIDGRYVGMIKISREGARIFKEIYDEGQENFSGRIWLNGRRFEQIFMTDFLQEIIRRGHKIYPVIVSKGWLEFDTNEDYEIITELNKKNKLGEFIRI